MANEGQATAWTETVGPIWLHYEEQVDRSAERFGTAAMEAAAITKGEMVLDVGCGTGPTTFELGRRVGPRGRVVGLDISPLLLGRAKEKARSVGATNVEFVHGDAQTHPLDPVYDLVFSRFGVMFFEDPVAAFANLRGAFSPKGRLAFACFQDLFRNVWMALPTMTAVSVLGVGLEPPTPGAPGPFALADADRIKQILAGAGYTDVNVRSFETAMDTEESEIEDRVGMVLRMGPLGDRIKDLDETAHRQVIDAVVSAAEEHRSDGVYRLPAAAWIVLAR